jgi:hypothetical protein
MAAAANGPRLSFSLFATTMHGGIFAKGKIQSGAGCSQEKTSVGLPRGLVRIRPYKPIYMEIGADYDNRPIER